VNETWYDTREVGMKTMIGIGLCAAVMVLHAEKHEFQMTPKDTYSVEDTEEWKATVERYRPLYYADVDIRPTKGSSFSLKLYFKTNMRSFMDDNRFDSPEAMKSMVIESSKGYLKHSVEKTIEVEEINPKGQYGFMTTITDASLVGKPIPKDEFLYMVRGMVCLSESGLKGSSLGFSLMTNSTNSPETKKIMDYIYDFAKERETPPTDKTTEDTEIDTEK